MSYCYNIMSTESKKHINNWINLQDRNIQLDGCFYLFDPNHTKETNIFIF